MTEKIVGRVIIAVRFLRKSLPDFDEECGHETMKTGFR